MKDNKVWQILEKEHKSYPEDFGHAVSLKDIKFAEEGLYVTFSDEYKKFLQSYGAAILPGHIIYGLSHMDIMGDVNKNVIDKTSFYRKQNWPYTNGWYIISDDGFGNPIGIDEKGFVWLSDPSSKPDKIKLANSFCKFLEKIILDELYK